MTQQAAKLKALMKARREDGEEEHSLPRKIVESELYDTKPTARFLLNQIAVMAMKNEEANYPEDAPKFYPDGVTPWEKTGWCWLSQHKLGLRVGITEGQVLRLVKDFREKGIILQRKWYDDHGTPHGEYKIVESVVDAFQRPSQNYGVERPKRYREGSRKATPGSFSSTNQPKKRHELDE
jgi:hypothetical protein